MRGFLDPALGVTQCKNTIMDKTKSCKQKMGAFAPTKH